MSNAIMTTIIYYKFPSPISKIKWGNNNSVISAQCLANNYEHPNMF